MSLGAAARLLAVALASAGATLLFARLAPRLGWTDAPAGPAAARKLQRRAVPNVGGAALLVGLACAPDAAWAGAGVELLGARWPSTGWLALALAGLFAVGTLDDRRGLGPGVKALAQLAALAPLAVGVLVTGAEGAPASALLLWVVGFAAVNALNTFDNADGALATLAASAFPFAEPHVAAAALGFLPLNLDAGRASNRASSAPTAYLGDAGAFVLGYFTLVHPRAWGLLWLPLLDLARLALVRTAAGSRPWIGDRRHLAHRLQARGWPPLAVALAQALVALPAAALVARAFETGEVSWALAGLGATALLFVAALCLGAAGSASLPCPPGGASE